MMKSFSRTMLLILLFAFTLRVYICLNTAIVNSDGAIFIDQARIVYYGLWNTLDSHENRLFSPYPLLIAAFFFFIKNWIVAANIVNLLLSTALLIPINRIARSYFNEETSILLTLLFAVIPTMAFNSTDVVREPFCCFFLALGLYFLTDSTRQTHSSVLISGFCFVLAFLTRVEMIVLIPVSVFYILLSTPEKKLSKSVVFIIPLVAVAIMSIVGVLYLQGTDVFQNRFSMIYNKLWHVFFRYDQVREYLASPIRYLPQGIPPSFFDSIRAVVWFIPVGIIFNEGMAAFHYPFFVLFLVGVLVAVKKRKGVKDLFYFSVSITVMFVLLYLYILANWEMEHRWMVPVIIYSFLFLGLGLEKVSEGIKKIKIINPSYVSILIFLMILLFTLPKDLNPREQDKRIFRNIGETIRLLEGGNEKLEILTVGNSYRWITFYANLPVRGAPYPDKYREYGQFINNKSYEDFMKKIRSVKIQYLVLEEKQWPSRSFDIPIPGTADLRKMGEWYHPDSGLIILYRILPISLPA